MTDTFIYHQSPPPLLPMYARAVLPKPAGSHDTPIPALSARILGVATNTRTLTSYRKVCQFSNRTQVPLTWPHILAFPLHLKLLTDARFPLPLLGLVHLSNSIIQHREIGAGENLDIHVRLGNQQDTRRGIEFDLITEVYSSGRLVWEETSVTLFRQPEKKTGSDQPRARLPELPSFSNTLEIRAPENTGRAYAAISGDRNPIHLHALTAKAFGFPRAIAHGMWSLARSVALLEQQEGWKPGAMRVECQFRNPLLLPGRARLNWQSGASGMDYQLLNEQGDAPCLNGQIHWL